MEETKVTATLAAGLLLTSIGLGIGMVSPGLVGGLFCIAGLVFGVAAMAELLNGGTTR